jgi:hypothetical protein
VATTTSGWAITSLIVSLAGGQVVPVIGPLMGAIFGHIALNDIKKSHGRLTGRGLAIGGIVSGYVFAALHLALYGFFFLYLFAFSSQIGG